MLKQTLFILFIFVLCSCHQDEKTNIKDLDFLDLTKKYIVENGIRETHLTLAMNIAQYAAKDTFAIFKYDTLGNIISTKYKMLFNSAGLTEYEYDSIGLVFQKTDHSDFTITFNYQHQFIPDSMTLIRYYKNYFPEDLYGHKLKISGIYKFDKKGKILHDAQRGDDEFGATTNRLTEYTYDPTGRLITLHENVELRENDSLYFYSPYEKITQFYYSSAIPDSAETTFYYFENDFSKNCYSIRTFYNSNGLIEKSIEENDFILIYRHIK